MRVGIVATEFFDRRLGRIGGFGWALAHTIRAFRDHPEAGVEPEVFAAVRQPVPPGVTQVHGVKLHFRQGSLAQQVRAIRRARPDLLLTIDYRPVYRLFLYALPRCPALIWSRDPWSDENRRELATLRTPVSGDTAPTDLDMTDCRSLRTVVRWSRWLRRPLAVGVPALFLRERFPGTFGLPPEIGQLLPNPLVLDPGVVKKAERPTVLFLGRLDSVKRPWLLCEIARRLPEVTFHALGGAFTRGPGVWRPEEVPANLHLHGHVEGEAKLRHLEAAWLLLNTSIHEGLPVSFQEALAYEVPIVAALNPEDVPRRFGRFVGTHSGDGSSAIEPFVAAVRHLVTDPAERTRLGREGRAWLEATHSQRHFLRTFVAIARTLRVPLPALDGN
jgi:glycosyltransferase involved in cell wall biosynthesis